MPDEYQVSEAARAFDPERYRVTAAKSRESEISDRVRLLSAGILTVVWGLFVGEPKGPNISHVRAQLLWAAGLSISALLLDYFESLLGYANAKVRWGNWLRYGVNIMFYAKQIATFAAAIALLVGAYRLLHVPPVTAQIHYTYWRGFTADDSDQSHQQHSSNLCISEPDPTTKKVTATKDTLHCDGSVDGGHLNLKCQQDLTLTGFLAERSSYNGTWAVAAVVGGQSSGTFEYSYVQDDACSVVSK
jgi:hypothetical protein